ncbi:MAG TPA: hypothetical protein VHU83_02970 [Bryobacteraceae bacterium]|nr:hypothetical protein [Bryobacteraceae bacterium]
MKTRRLLPIIATVLSLASADVSSCHQVQQSSTALCGKRSHVQTPGNIRFASDEANGVSYVRFDVRDEARTLTLHGVESVEAVCSLAANESVIFGVLAGGAPAGFEVAIANPQDGALLDSWDSYTPVMSPDQRWIALRKFYPPQTALTISEEYLLYPLLKVQAEAHAPRNQSAEPPSSAIVVYPSGQTNAFMSNIGVPADQVHVFRSKSFYWSEDSHAVLFADSVQESLSAILVQLNDGGVTTLVYPLSPANVCGTESPPDLTGVTMADADVGPDGGDRGREIQMKFESSSSACKSRLIVLGSSDFQRPKPEYHPAGKRRPSKEVEH